MLVYIVQHVHCCDRQSLLACDFMRKQPAGWVLTDAACMAYSLTSVPLYDTLGPDAVTYIAGHAELSVIACSIDVLDTLIKCLPDCPTVKLVVSSLLPYHNSAWHDVNACSALFTYFTSLRWLLHGWCKVAKQASTF